MSTTNNSYRDVESLAKGSLPGQLPHKQLFAHQWRQRGVSCASRDRLVSLPAPLFYVPAVELACRIYFRFFCAFGPSAVPICRLVLLVGAVALRISSFSKAISETLYVMGYSETSEERVRKEQRRSLGQTARDRALLGGEEVRVPTHLFLSLKLF